MAKKPEILSTETIKPEVVEKDLSHPKDEKPQWCIYCKNYVKAAKGRPYMVCAVRGGTREPDSGSDCEYFERKK